MAASYVHRMHAARGTLRLPSESTPRTQHCSTYLSPGNLLCSSVPQVCHPGCVATAVDGARRRGVGERHTRQRRQYRHDDARLAPLSALRRHTRLRARRLAVRARAAAPARVA
eukprot:569269-Prymnesium_polylepis.1